MKRDKVIIFGVLRQEDYPLEAPIGDESYDVWCMNASWPAEHWDCWFQLHGIEHMMEAHGIKYIRWLQTVAAYHKSKTVYVFEHELHHFPGAEAFPLPKLIEEFGDYFTGSFAYLTAFAILRRYKKIWIDTRGMEGEEWAIPCIEYYIGIAEERGIVVHVGSNSDLLHRRRGGLYGIGRDRGGNFGELD